MTLTADPGPYIFKLDTDQGILTNTYEYVKDQVTEQ